MIKLVVATLILSLVVTAALTGVLLDFIFLYPLFLTFLWIIGGLFFYYRIERKSPGPDILPELKEYPLVSLLIPCFNEGDNAAETIGAACNQNWPNLEVIAINDGSADNTGQVLVELTKQYPQLRVVQLAENQGKAMAMRMGALAARGEFLVCIDGDAILHHNATAYLVKPLIDNPRVGAVTGNPRVRTRSTFLGKVQVGEFSSIVGLIKRAQRIYGHIFTVSGVIASFRRRALHSCGYWDPSMITEDIDISWSLQLKHWQIQYEPNALCWILMPETIRGLRKQRVRWSQGGAEVFLKNISHLWAWRVRRMWMLALDYFLSTSWAYCYLFSVMLWGLGKFMVMPPSLNVPTLFPPAFWGLALATVNLFQFVVALTLETRYEPKLPRLLIWMIWYPFFFWLVSMLSTLEGVPRAFLKRRPTKALWDSSDRGFR